MKNAFDLTGNRIGLFDGRTIKDVTGNILYWLSEGEVFARMSYAGSNAPFRNRGQFNLIGEFIDCQCLVDGEVIFRIPC
jgi:hypothetical protein